MSPGFFDLFRLPRLQGRDITWNDGPGKPDVALLSASLARALFPAGDAVGHHLRLVGPQPRDLDVIGVVADAPYIKLDDPRPFVVFRPILQDLARSQFPMAYVRASGDLATVRDGYARVVKTLGHRLLRGFITSSEWVNHALLRERFTAGLAAFAAALTSVLACMGVYGLLAYSVTARVREIGVRLALGASRGTVIWMIVRDGLAIAVPGVLLGAPCAWAAARLARAQLYGIAPGDPRTLVIAAAISLATVLAASLFRRCAHRGWRRSKHCVRNNIWIGHHLRRPRLNTSGSSLSDSLGPSWLIDDEGSSRPARPETRPDTAMTCCADVVMQPHSTAASTVGCTPPV